MNRNTPLECNIKDGVGGRCRDCADENGVCPSSGLPCAGAEKAVRHVFAAYNYGVENGFIKN